MQQVNPGFRHAVTNGRTRNSLAISVIDSGGTTYAYFDNKNIVSESLKLTQAICDEPDIKFGGCIASTFEIELSGVPDLTGKRITVGVTSTAYAPTYPGAHLIPGGGAQGGVYPGGSRYNKIFAIFTGTVDSCRLQKNHITRQLVAYDDFARLNDIDCTTWYRSLYANATTITIGDLRDAIIRQYDIVQAASGDTQTHIHLPADSFPVYMMGSDGITVGGLLRMIAEWSGVFLRLDGNGLLVYTTAAIQTIESYDYYIDAEAEDFTHSGFDGLYIPQLGTFGFTEDHNNLYLMDNELISTGYTSPGFAEKWAEVRELLQPNFSAPYVPAELRAGCRLWVDPGDRIEFNMRWYELSLDGSSAAPRDYPVSSLVLSRRISGIQAMQDEMTADGESTIISDEE